MTIDHGLSPELRELRARVQTFINDEVIPAERTVDEEDDFYGGTLQALRDSAKTQGLWALGHPKEIGGGGLSFMPFVYLNEIIGRSDIGQMAMGAVTMQDSIMFHLYGTREQKDRWLTPLVAGETMPSVGLTEPEVAGSDPILMETRAHLDGDEWVINGHKWFTSYANMARFTTVFCRTDDNEDNKYRRFTAIIVPTDTPGYEIIRQIPTMGDMGTHCEVHLTDVRVPRSSTLGARGEGFVIAQKRLGPGRIFHCMRWLGQAQRAFELMCERATTAARTALCWLRRAKSSATSPSPRPKSMRPASNDSRRGAAPSTLGNSRG